MSVNADLLKLSTITGAQLPTRLPTISQEPRNEGGCRIPCSCLARIVGILFFPQQCVVMVLK